MVKSKNPDLGVGTPRPPVEERSAAPQAHLHKGWLVRSLARFALAPHYGSICGWGLSIGKTWIGGVGVQIRLDILIPLA